MTSNPFFHDYVEKVQEQMALFTFSDDQVQEFLQNSNKISTYQQLREKVSTYQPKNFIFEVLVRTPKHMSHEHACRRMFDPHVSQKLIESWDPDSTSWDPNSLTQCFFQFFDLLEDRDIDLDGIQWETSEANQLGIKDLSLGLRTLKKIYQSAKDSRQSSIDFLSFFSDKEVYIIRKTLCNLIRRYEVEYIPSNVAASAVIYEAWKHGRLLSLDNRETNLERFNDLLSALFIKKSEIPTKELLAEMTEKLELAHLKDIGFSQLSNNQIWQRNIPEKAWFGIVETALIHRFDRKTFDYYLIHYPLIIDGYWFVGLVYLLARADGLEKYSKDEIPEFFCKNKYSKLYNNLKSVTESLKFSLRLDALSKISHLLEKGATEQEIFLECVKHYFVCFDVEKTDFKPDKKSIRSQIIYNGNGIKLYGPEWITKEHKQKVRKELEGDKTVFGITIPGLIGSIKEEIQKSQAIQFRGRKEQGSLFAHQAAGLVKEVWGDKELREGLHPQSKASLWHLRTLIEINGDFDFEAERSICDGLGADFREREFDATSELLEYFVDISLRHALRRASYRSIEETPRTQALDKKVRHIAAELLLNQDADPLQQFKNYLEWQPLNLRDGDLHDWFLRTKGFVHCFHHCFWQSAYHAFRARCDNSNPPYLWVETSENRLIIFNKESSIHNKSGKNRPRDSGFYKVLENRMNSFIKIDGPKRSSENENFWEVSICHRI